MEEVRKISFNIYARDEAEAEEGRKAIVHFINVLGQHGARFSGHKISEAVGKLYNNSFVTSQIIKFFKE